MAMAATSDELADKKDDRVMESLEAIYCNLPQDVLEDILLRLPVKDLLRFRCVSKSLLALIDAPTFIRTHHSVHYAIHKARGDMPLLTWKSSIGREGYPIECRLLSKDQGGDNDTILNWTSDIECFTNTNSIIPNDDPGILLDGYCKGSANGIICLQFQGIDTERLGREYYYCALWNPASRQFKVVPCPPHVPNQHSPGQFHVRGFGFDPLSNDFKIVATTTVVSEINLLYMVYTLSTDSWKKVCQPSLLGSSAFVRNSSIDACLNGVYYWTAGLNNVSDDQVYRILSFNLSTEVFRFSDPPQEALPPVDDWCNGFYWNIGLYNECLALYISRPDTTFEIWAVSEFDNDLGVPLAWQCLFSIKPFYEQIIFVFGAPRMDGDFIFKIRSASGLILYNPTTGKFRKLEIEIGACLLSHVESLFPLSRRAVVG